MPSPTMATRRPLSASRSRAWSRCLAPLAVLRWPWMRPAVAENGGFMTTRVGTEARGRMLCSCSAFSPVTVASGNRSASSSRRRSDSSLSISLAPASSDQIARSPVPAEGSSTMSSGRTLAVQLATKARAGGVENCWNSSISSSRRVCVGRRCTRPVRSRAFCAAASRAQASPGRGLALAQMEIDRDLEGVVGVLGEPLALGLGAAEDIRRLGGELARGQRLTVGEPLVQTLREP